MNLSTPTHKNMWKHGKPKDKRRSNGGKKKKTKNEELIGNSRLSLKKSPCDKDSQEGMAWTEIATLQTRRWSLAWKLKLNSEITEF
jgi:hypothetical protein